VSARVELRIRHLIADGLPMSGVDAALFRQGIQAELGRLIAERGIASGEAAGTSIGTLRGESTAGRSPAAHPTSLGTAVAGIVHRGIGR
jgi:hypothetical protein